MSDDFIDDKKERTSISILFENDDKKVESFARFTDFEIAYMAYGRGVEQMPSVLGEKLAVSEEMSFYQGLGNAIFAPYAFNNFNEYDIMKVEDKPMEQVFLTLIGKWDSGKKLQYSKINKLDEMTKNDVEMKNRIFGMNLDDKTEFKKELMDLQLKIQMVWSEMYNQKICEIRQHRIDNIVYITENITR